MWLNDYRLIAVALFCCLTGIAGILLVWRTAKQQKRLAELSEGLKAAMQRLDDIELKRNDQSFAADMNRAQIKARLENAGTFGNPHEKYRYIASMVAQGMKAHEIAEVLNIPPREAEQLVNLSKVAKSEA